MNDIKLRMWNKFDKIMFYDIGIINWNNKTIARTHPNDYTYNLASVELMLCSDLKDKSKPNPKEIYEQDLIRRFVIRYQEQRSFPEYIDFREWEIIEVISEVIRMDGCFYLKPIKKYIMHDTDCNNPHILEMEILKDCIPPPINKSEIIDRSDIDAGVIEYQGCELNREDIGKLKIFEVIGNIHENQELLK